MALDSYRSRETKKIVEKPKTAEEHKKELQKQMESLRWMRNELARESNSDIDQKWVRENESKEVRYNNTTSTTVNNQVSQNQRQERNKDDEYLDEYINRLRRETQFQSSELPPELQSMDKIQQNTVPFEKPVESIAVQPAEPTSEEPPVQPPVIESMQPIKEKIQPQEPVVTDNSELIEELNNKIDKKYNLLISKLENLYNSEVINSEADSISNDLQSLMDIKNRSLEELKKVDEALNSLISRYAILEQKAEEVKTTDDFRIDQQNTQVKSLEDYQANLQKKYGNYWFGKMTEKEKEQYITLYTAAHKVPREIVEKQIEDSIAIAYNEIVSSTKQNTEIQKETSVAQDNQPEHQQFRGNYENIIKFNGRQATETLKQIHSGLQFATPEQVAEFNYLYSALSTLSKTKPTNYEEEQQKLTQLYDLTDRIDQLRISIINSNGKSR